MAKHPRNYADKKTPLTMDIMRIGDFSVQEMPADLQARNLMRSLDKTKKQISRLIERRNREPSNAVVLEKQIRNREGIYTMKLIKLIGIHKKTESQDKKDATRKENLKKEMAQHIKNLDKIKPKFNPMSEIVPTKNGNIEQVKDSRPLVKRVGNKVKRRSFKTFANK